MFLGRSGTKVRGWVQGLIQVFVFDEGSGFWSRGFGGLRLKP